MTGTGWERKREALNASLEFCREDDVLVITKLDRLAGLTFYPLGAVAEFERDLINERRNEGTQQTKECAV